MDFGKTACGEVANLLQTFCADGEADLMDFGLKVAA